MRSRRLAVCVSRLAAGGTQRAAAGAGPGRCPSGRRALSAAAAAPERKKAEPGPAAAADRMDEPLVWPGAEAADADALAKRGNDWMNLAAIVFERQPVLMKELPEWEREHRAYQDINKDVMYQRELYVSPRIREVEALAKTDGSARAAPEEDAPNTRSTRELVPMTPATRRSSARALDDRLYLIVKARDPLEPKRLVWQFPTVRYRSEKPAKEEGAPAIPMSMRSTVIDGVISYFSDQVSAYPVGYSPVAHLCFELPEAQQEMHDAYGKKLFFYRVQYLGGDIELNRKRVADFAWVTKQELEDYFPKPTARRMKALLLQ